MSEPNAARVHQNTRSPSAPTPKRRRLNLACNYCRSRKTRCDEQTPSCHACLAAGLACITTDPRKPNQHVERREAGKGPNSSAVTTGSVQPPEQDIVQHPGASNVSPGNTPTTVLDDACNEQSPAMVQEEDLPPAPRNNTRDNFVGQRFRGLLPILRHEVGSTSVDVLTGWLNVASFRLGLGQSFGVTTPYNAHQYHDSFPIPAPSISNLSDLSPWVSNYFQNVHPVYPVVDQEGVYTLLDKFQTYGILTLISNTEYLSHIVTTLVVLDIGSGGFSTAGSDTCDLYLFAKDLLGRLIGRPTFPNIKALFLLALDMYYHDDLASAWSTLTLCISTATAIGLSKSRNILAADPNYTKEDGMRTWWSIFVLENLIAFETGRKSSISSDGILDLDLTALSANASVDNGQGPTLEEPEDMRFFKFIIGFAKILGEIGNRCIDIRDREEVSGKDQIQRLVAEKVKITGESCVQLTKWAETLPDNIRPGSDLIYDRRTFPQAAFISLHYYNALLALTRNSLLISEAALRDTTEVLSKDQPWGYIIRNGHPTVASSARKLIKLFIEAEESGASLLIPHTNASLHALYVLAVHLLRHPDTMLRKTDLDVSSIES